MSDQEVHVPIDWPEVTGYLADRSPASGPDRPMAFSGQFTERPLMKEADMETLDFYGGDELWNERLDQLLWQRGLARGTYYPDFADLPLIRDWTDPGEGNLERATHVRVAPTDSGRAYGPESDIP